MIEKKFAVKSTAFRTYVRFRESLEQLGYKHCESFTEFTNEQLSYCNCLYISNDFKNKGEFQFSFSNTYSGETRTYNIDDTMQFWLAVDYAKELIKEDVKEETPEEPVKPSDGPVKISFGVRSNNFNVYSEFAKDLDQIGYKANLWFNPFNPETSVIRNGIYIGTEWNNNLQDPAYAFSNISVGDHGCDIIFDLDAENGYFKAIMHARDKFEWWKNDQSDEKDPEEGMVIVTMAEIAAWAKCDIKNLLIKI